jgi:hypothetical protein
MPETSARAGATGSPLSAAQAEKANRISPSTVHATDRAYGFTGRSSQRILVRFVVIVIHWCRCGVPDALGADRRSDEPRGTRSGSHSTALPSRSEPEPDALTHAAVGSYDLTSQAGTSRFPTRPPVASSCFGAHIIRARRPPAPRGKDLRANHVLPCANRLRCSLRLPWFEKKASMWASVTGRSRPVTRRILSTSPFGLTSAISCQPGSEMKAPRHGSWSLRHLEQFHLLGICPGSVGGHSQPSIEGGGHAEGFGELDASNRPEFLGQRDPLPRLGAHIPP